MNSIHDLGGMHGMGPIAIDKDEPIFAGEWERLTFGTHILTLMTGLYTADETRHSMERLPPVHWLASSYYEHWLDGTEMLLLEKGIATKQELATGKATEPLPEWVAKLDAIPVEAIEEIVTTNHPVMGEPEGDPKYSAGDKIKARNINPRTHTRLPRYVRGKVGTIIAYRGPCFFADARTVENPDVTSHTYTVRFEGDALWGPDAGVKDAVYIDLYEAYLEDL